MMNQPIQSPWVEGLNPPQTEAVLHTEGPLLVLAGAGSGKTSVLTHRIAHLIDQKGVSPSDILAITFTNKAAKEMQERLTQLIGPSVSALWVGTFHAMMVRILRRHADRLGYTARFVILDTDDQNKLLKELYRSLNIDEKKFPLRQARSAISEAKNRGEVDFAFRDKPAFIQLPALAKAYQAQLKASDAMDFDDLLGQAIRLFETYPEILAEYQARFRYILVDEYQDTNHVQYRLVSLLAARYKNLCVVGDDDQSIYAFRGADIQNILNFERDYPQAKVIKLEQNYRSSGHILQAANAVIAHNQGRKEKRLWTAAGSGERIAWMHVSHASLEAERIAADIRRQVEGPSGLRYRDIAILYRINAISRNLEMGLSRYNIPCRIYGSLRFWDHKEVKDCLAYCRLLANPQDRMSFRRIINVPRRGIGEVTLSALLQLSDETGRNPLDLCREAAMHPALSRARVPLMAFAALMDGYRAQLPEVGNLRQFVQGLQEDSGLRAEIKSNTKESESQRQDRLNNLDELLNDCSEFQASAELQTFAHFAQSEDLGDELDRSQWPLGDVLDAYCEKLALGTVEAESDDVVSLMSIHAAKGLEFERVYVVGLEEGLFPGYQNQSGPGLEEERRLAYVAYTRAKRALVLCTVDMRQIYNTQYSGARPSRFLRDIPETHLLIPADRQMAYHGQTEGPSQGEMGWAGEALETQSYRQELARIKARKAESQPKQATPSDPSLLRLDELRVGLCVRHPRFGEGVIKQHTPTATDAIVFIEFEDRDRRLMANDCKLQRVNS